MRDLWNAERRRFQTWGLAYALLHLAVLGFMARMVDPLQQPLLVYQVVAAVYWLTGLLFGLYQMGGYRRANTWLQLLHRPLAAQRIASALLAAGVFWLFVAIAVPLFLIIAGQELWTARVVDWRHALLPLSAWLIASLAYLSGAYVMLAPRRYAAAILVFSALLPVSAAGGVAMLAVQSLLGAIVLWLLRGAFKPDLSALPTATTARVATALAVQMGLYLLLVAATIAIELVWIMLGSHPLNGAPPSGGYVEATRAEGADLIAAGLAVSSLPEAPVWRDQVRISEVVTLAAEFDVLPRRHELTNVAPLEFDDETRGVRHAFSHDEMRFTAIRLADGRALAPLGIGAAQERFTQPPLPVGRDLLLAGNSLYQYDNETGRIDLRLRVADGETLAAPPQPLGESMLVLSDHALYVFDTRSFRDSVAELQAKARLAIDVPAGDVSRIDVFEVLDGHLVSIIDGAGRNVGPGNSRQLLMQFGGSAPPRLVAERALPADFPTWLRTWAWWMSPALHQLRAQAIALLADARPLDVRTPHQAPASMKLLAAALSLLSAVFCLLWTRHWSRAPRARLAWTLACALVGLPALLSLRLLHPELSWRTRPDARLALAAA